MYTLAMETSHQFLLLVLMDDEKVIDYYKESCLKQQSEFIIPEADKLLKKNNVTIEEIGNIVVTAGPGSYTGVRIGMTVAKVLGSVAGKNVYTLSTLQLYAGLKKALVLMDARAKRCYVGQYENGKAVKEDCVLYNSEIETMLDTDQLLVGDLHLFGKEDYYPDLAQNFFDLKPMWQKVENVDILTPVYLKSSQEYLKK